MTENKKDKNNYWLFLAGLINPPLDLHDFHLIYLHIFSAFLSTHNIHASQSDITTPIIYIHLWNFPIFQMQWQMSAGVSSSAISLSPDNLSRKQYTSFKYFWYTSSKDSMNSPLFSHLYLLLLLRVIFPQFVTNFFIFINQRYFHRSPWHFLLYLL